MKKIILSIVLILSITHLMAQDDAVLQLYIAQKQYEKAKEEVDKMMANPKLKDKDKPHAYLWTMLVYSNIYNDSASSIKYPNADVQAMDAFYKYQPHDPELKQMKEGHFESGIGNVDQGYINRGNVYWTDKNYDSAFSYFSRALGTRKILYSNNLTQTTSTFDTTLTLFTGIAAQESKHYDSAAKYYSQLADLKIAQPDYKSIYEFLIQYYSQQKNNEAFNKYLALAKELYPADNALWSQYEISNMTANSSTTELLKKYKEEIAAGVITEQKLVGYAEAFTTNDSTELKGMDSAQKAGLKLAAAEAYGKAYNMSGNNGLYAFGAGYYYFLTFETLDDRYNTYKGTSAELKAKREEVAKQEEAYADTAAPWLEKAYTDLSAKQDRERIETSNLNHTVDFLATIYMWKRDRTKVTGSKDYDKYDALYKKYDDLHNSFK